jgi:hypothetical protein
LGRPCQCCEEASSSSSVSISSISVSSSVPSSSSSSVSSEVVSSILCRCIVRFEPTSSNSDYLTCPDYTDIAQGNCYKINGTYNQGSGGWNVSGETCPTATISGGALPNAANCLGPHNIFFGSREPDWPDGRNYPQLNIPDLWTNDDGGGNHLLIEKKCPHIGPGISTSPHGNMYPKPDGDWDDDGVITEGTPIPDGCSIPDTQTGRNSRSPNASCTSMTITCLKGPVASKACQDSDECPCEDAVDDNGDPVRPKVGLPEECPDCEYKCLDATQPPGVDGGADGECRKNGGNCCLRSAGPQDLDCDGIIHQLHDLGPPGICVTWSGTSNIPIYSHPDRECDNCGERNYNFGVSCDDAAEFTGFAWTFVSEIFPKIPECESVTPADPDGPAAILWPIFGDVGIPTIWDLASNESGNEVLILNDDNMKCEDGACLWECMDDGEKTYYGILLDDTDCTTRSKALGKPCGCPPSGPDGPCEPGDIIATQCGE